MVNNNQTFRLNKVAQAVQFGIRSPVKSKKKRKTNKRSQNNGC